MAKYNYYWGMYYPDKKRMDYSAVRPICRYDTKFATPRLAAKAFIKACGNLSELSPPYRLIRSDGRVVGEVTSAYNWVKVTNGQ